MTNYFLTADSHFSHKNIIRFCGRPFASVEEHDEALISNHNAVVGRNDIVVHLGDFCFFDEPDHFMKIFNRLNGKFIVLRGNHDKNFHRNAKDGKRISDHFMEYYPAGQAELKIYGEKYFMNHYPCMSWNASCHDRLHFFGHRHSSPNKIVAHMPNSYDCGVDNNGYSPIPLEEAIRKAKENDPGTLDTKMFAGLSEIE